MNKKEEKKVQALLDELQVIKDEIDDLIEEENDALENVPENLAGSEKYEEAEDIIASLESAASGVEDAIDELESF